VAVGLGIGLNVVEKESVRVAEEEKLNLTLEELSITSST
jgi:hypothetical protein